MLKDFKVLSTSQGADSVISVKQKEFSIFLSSLALALAYAMSHKEDYEVTTIFNHDTKKFTIMTKKLSSIIQL